MSSSCREIIMVLLMKCQIQCVKSRFSRCASAEISCFGLFVAEELVFPLWPCLIDFQMRVAAGTTDVQLVKLTPNTAYSLSLYALYGLSASEALLRQGVTCMSEIIPFFKQCYILAIPMCKKLIQWHCLIFSANATCRRAECSGCHPQHHGALLGCCSRCSSQVHYHLHSRGRWN